jgi:small subunit ribosomal protein S7
MVGKKDIKDNTDFFTILNKYDTKSVKIEDKGLEKYIKLDTKDLFLGAPHANRMFGKSKLSIIERLVNNLMRTEVYTGKKIKSYKTVRSAFEIIEKRSKDNPIQVL